MQSRTSCIDNQPDAANKPKALLISTFDDLPQALTSALEQLDLEIYRTTDAESILNSDAVVAILALNDLLDLEKDHIKNLTEQIQKLSLGILVVTAQNPRQIDQYRTSGNFENLFFAESRESTDMLKGRLATLMDIFGALRNMNSEITRLELFQQPLNQYFSRVNEEMRLAARLQQDFLPRDMPQIPNLSFATVFRPASYVSGDVYDVSRLDERHVGFYIADAVGHGVPAALLTMFIKRAMITKHIEEHSYTLIEPGIALARLNDDMVGQDLTNFQFATCCYALLNTETLQMRIANGGHPPPILIDRQGQSRELDTSGSLLGVFPDQKYDTSTVQLQPGDKLLLFSDGVEVAFVNEGPDQPLRFRREFGSLAEYDIQTMCDKLVEIINRQEGSLHPKDDVTIVGLEITTP